MKNLLLLVMLLTSTATWGQISGTEMLHRCSAAVRHDDGEKLNGEELVEATYCLGYASGFLDAIPVVELASNTQPNVCVPQDGLDIKQAVRIFVKYLREHPEDLYINARLTFYKSILMAFPCKR